MPVLIRALLSIVIASGVALADDAARIVLADPDPELQRAVRATLGPWNIEVIVGAPPPTDEAQAQQQGDASSARFIVWRIRGDLVVFDRERGVADHRDTRDGSLDPASAAAAALTIKTLMRLAPPEDRVAGELRHDPVVPARPGGVGLRVQTGFGTRMARGDTTELGARASLAVMLRPLRSELRLGVAGELGTEAGVQHSGFKGMWRDWSMVALASWTVRPSARWSIEPFVGAGITRSMLDGEEPMMTARHERATLATARGGVFGRVQAGRFSIGGSLGIDAFSGTPTYTRAGMKNPFFEVPPLALSLGVILAADLTR